MSSIIGGQYGQKVRARAAGVLIEEGKILLVKMLGLGRDGIFWSPPGGGIEFGETIAQTIEREFLEETGLIVRVKEFLLLNEYIEPPLHAIELFYSVERLGGELITGKDPEMQAQIISEVCFLSKSELHSLAQAQKHPRIEEMFG